MSTTNKRDSNVGTYDKTSIDSLINGPSSDDRQNNIHEEVQKQEKRDGGSHSLVRHLNLDWLVNEWMNEYMRDYSVFGSIFLLWMRDYVFLYIHFIQVSGFVLYLPVWTLKQLFNSKFWLERVGRRMKAWLINCEEKESNLWGFGICFLLREICYLSGLIWCIALMVLFFVLFFVFCAVKRKKQRVLNL